MIIFVGGLVGAGKSTIAKGMAQWFGVPYYDVDALKNEIFPLDPDFEKNVREGIPFSDETRQKVFDRAVADIEALCAEHECLVVDEVLHMSRFRHMLFDAADRVGGGFIVVWVRASEENILARLGGQQRDGHVLTNPIPMHLAMLKAFEEFQRSVVVCNNDGEAKDSIADLVHLLTNIHGLMANPSHRSNP